MVNLNGGLVLAEMCECANRDATPVSVPRNQLKTLLESYATTIATCSNFGGRIKAVLERGWLGRLTVQEVLDEIEQVYVGMDGDLEADAAYLNGLQESMKGAGVSEDVH